MIDTISFDDQGLIPVIAQDVKTKEVLMLAYANREALEKTLETNQAHYYSRSRKALWYKGATSGHIQHIQDIRYDCDSDAVLYLVRQEGAACHTGNRSCFYQSMKTGEKIDEAMGGLTLAFLQQVIAERRSNPQEGSYTNYLFEKGIDKILKKVGEESAEIIIAAKNDSKEETTYETADLLYHLTVLLTTLGLEWSDIMAELQKRTGK
ncbi:MAG: bifunctional phosphoribosyl-AMP cyclohydrolase/phosphoribosyl-ATP diphosphatase HisIE [Defluviitaleaceae bacterium]|nr:bifunctional phosphoribosyl-AMP cyclohydrolase/phosphoribosyl-ATP diphosphatase HisIE [Defluviitaleaceae bacterium]